VTKSHIARASRPGFGSSPGFGLRPEFGSSPGLRLRPGLGLSPGLAQGLVLGLVLGVVVTLSPTPLRAQQSGGGWFVPPQTPAAGAPGQSRPQPGSPRQAPPAEAAGPQPVGPPGTEPMMPMEPQAPLPPLQVQLPPMPDIPPIPKGSPTPAAIVGVLSVPDILRVSTAYQVADKELQQRRAKLNDDGQKEQASLRDLGQSFANERAKLTPEQIRQREKDYADRVNESRRKFSERARVIQEAGQYVMAQIERVIEVVAQQVAASRGVNLVLNRAQVLGTTADFDLTPQVAEVVNKVMPTVLIPPDGVSPSKLSAPPMAGPRVSATPEPAATPAKN
jgi:Skp family chaperone for outer membrane proteins